ncbi:hypothetical protein HJG60_010910 [Phyllostomus discolor]|uniref:Uncharacterized protein n=1 Tax=Phyllostomus discolor TaxID=89673 RepID=A0A834AEV9_9CHIR|nr:hypothetical protein HJG60_010910 [Phyllostomus discolor]
MASLQGGFTEKIKYNDSCNKCKPDNGIVGLTLRQLGGAGGIAQLVGVLSSRSEGCKFNSQSGYMPGLQVQFPVRACMGGNQSMFLSLSLLSSPPHLSLSPPLLFSLSSLPPSSLSESNKKCPRVRIKKEKPLKADN